MKSPYPPYAEALLKTERTTQKYKGEEFEIVDVYWYDPVTNQTFDTTGTGDASINQVYNAYRVKHGLPFPDELTALRTRLGLSAAKMSAILGLGVNQYRLYEKGDMPVDAVGRYIKMLINNKSALRDCVANAAALLTANEYKTAFASIDNISNELVPGVLLLSRDKSNGYASVDANRLRNVILHFLNVLGPLSPTFLNKLLFYTDFISYRQNAMAITGLSYRALPYGPVPENWKYIPLIEGIDQQEADLGTLLSTVAKADYTCLSPSEIGILNAVTERFRGMTASAISTLSHQENAWIESRDDVKKPISFDYAFTIKAL